MSINESTSRHIAPIAIRNYKQIFTYLFFSVIFISVAIISHDDFYGIDDAALYIFLFCIILAAVFVKFFFMSLKGIVIDVEKGTIGIPGWGKSVNSLGDIAAKIRYVSVPISSIESMSSDVKMSVGKEGNVSYEYYVIISGSNIGSYRIKVDNESKKQHLMTVIANAANLR